MDVVIDMVIDTDSATAPYEQLRAYLAGRIVDGELAVGTKLPTVRAFATDLGLAANTVARAYRELEAAGLLETRGRAGTFVGSGGDASRENVRRAAADYAATARASGLSVEDALAIVTGVLRSG